MFIGALLGSQRATVSRVMGLAEKFLAQRVVVKRFSVTACGEAVRTSRLLTPRAHYREGRL